MQRKLMATLCLLMFPLALVAQSPKLPSTSRTLSSVRAHLRTGSFPRVRTVCPGGTCDYTTIKAAVDYVTTQTPTGATPWVIEVHHGTGTYAESPMTIPEHVTVQAMKHSLALAFTNKTTITCANASGTCITLTGGFLSGFTVTHAATLTAPANIIAATSATAVSGLINLDVRWTTSSATHELIPLNVSGAGGVSVYYCGFASVGNSTNTTMVRVSGTGVAMIYDSYFNDNNLSPPRGLQTTDTGRIDLVRSVVGRAYGASSFTNDLVNDGGVIYSVNSSWRTATGAVNVAYSHPSGNELRLGTCLIRQGAGAPEGAVTGSVCDLWLRTDGGAGTTLCVKESGTATNTGWICK